VAVLLYTVCVRSGQRLVSYVWTWAVCLNVTRRWWSLVPE